MQRFAQIRPQLIQQLRRAQSTTSSSSVRVFDLPELSNMAKYRESGIPGLLSSQGLQIAYFQRIDSHLTKLNDAIVKSSLPSGVDLEVLIDENAKAAKHVDIFNNASLVNNISFAMKSLGDIREGSKEIPSSDRTSIVATPDIFAPMVNEPIEPLLSHIQKDFGSLIEFKTLLLNSANSINGDGFTWLVARDSNRFKEEIQRSDPTKMFDNLFILNTYNAGSPKNNGKAGHLTELKRRLQKGNDEKEELSTSTIPTFENAQETVQFEEVGYKPLLAIDASPKVWLHDYGVYGKRAYLEQVWKSIDWEIVAERLPENKVSVIPESN